MNEINIGKLIGALFLFFKFIIIPLFSCLIVFIKIFTLKGMLKKAGINYHKEQNYKISKWVLYLNIALIIGLVFNALLRSWTTLIFLFSAPIILGNEFIINKIYGNVSRIYENGIIDNNKNLFDWKEIHSYKIIDNAIFGYFNNGNRFDYKNMDMPNEIEKLFNKHKIMKR